MRELELTEKLEILMSLAAEDREGPPEANRVRPPRLRPISTRSCAREKNGCSPTSWRSSASGGTSR